MSMLEDIPAWTHRLAMKRLVQLWMNLPQDDPDIPAPLPPVTSRPYSRIHEIHSRYEEMAAAEAEAFSAGEPILHVWVQAPTDSSR